MNKLNTFKNRYLPPIETQLQQEINRYTSPGFDSLYSMLRYHMGWEGEGSGEQARGKRIRPLLVLLSATASGASWHDYLPIAASVELVHNFSLIHDDIEDNSEIRRGRKTAWAKWGIPQAINVGDLLFTIAHLSIIDPEIKLPQPLKLQAANLLHHTCVQLTQGQYLDMDFETRNNVAISEYWKMIEGKTAALICCSMELGSLQLGHEKRNHFKEFGRLLGLAFQIQDDILGLWGDTAITGKSSNSDLISRKKTLPVLYALEKNATFVERWQKGICCEEEASEIAAILKEDGTYEYTKNLAVRLTKDAIINLELINLANDATDALVEIANQLITRSQ